METGYNLEELMNTYFAPYLILNDDIVIRSSDSIINKLKFIVDLIKSKYKEGIKFKKDKEYNIILNIPSLHLDISSEFINIIENTNKSTSDDIGLYQDYLIARGYGYEKPIDELFDLNNIDLAYWLNNDEILKFKETFFFEIADDVFVKYIISSSKKKFC